MIGSLQGVVGAVGEDAALIDVNGVGYVVHAGARTLARLEVGVAARISVETHVREDAIKLYGFVSETERAWFQHLQSVQGVGARVALAILDALGPDDLADAVALQDKASVARANGVGPKLAARIVQELAGKSGPRGFLSLSAAGPARMAANGAGGANGARGEAVSALINLGIDQSSATRAVASAAKSLAKDEAGEPDAPELIRAALKEVSR
jgi:Holliday junction DNA helicase RuvA